MTYYDVAIIGGGVFGCSVAKQLAERSALDVCLFEKEYHLAAHQSGRNSGTVHPGLALDLNPGTRKARFAVEGGRKLIEYCHENDLPIHDCGLMLVGTTDAEIRELQRVRDRTEKVGIDVRWLDAEEIRKREPRVEGQRALYTPDSATVDGQSITYSFAREAWNDGVQFYMGHEVQELERTADGMNINTNKGSVTADYLVNAAGVWAAQFADQLGLTRSYHMVPLRGQYYELRPEIQSEVRTNVYPTSMPPRIPNSVGIHFTRRPDGKVIVGPTGMIAFGPDTYGKTDIDLHEVSRMLSSTNFWKFIRAPKSLQIAWTELNKTYRKDVFVDQCRRLIPDIQSADLTRSYVGISPFYVTDSGEFVDESVFDTGPRSMHILRPKPGVTSSLSIGEYVTDHVLDETRDT